MEPAAQKIRYTLGQRDDRGRRPVHVDGQHVGHVRNSGRGSQPWSARGLGDEISTHHHSQAEAAERLVRMVDARAMVAQQTERRLRMRTEAPKGWAFAPWSAIADNAVVRIPHKIIPVYGEDGPYYPETFSAPVTLRHVERLPNGCIVASGDQLGDPDPYVLLMTPRHVEIGALVPAGAVPAGAGPAPTDG